MLQMKRNFMTQQNGYRHLKTLLPNLMVSAKKVVVQFEENNFLAFEYLGWDNHAIARSSRVRENFTCVFGYPRNSAQLTPGKGCILTKYSKRFREGTPLEEHFCHG